MWYIYIVIIVFCEVVPSDCSLFLYWCRHWSKWLITHWGYFGTTVGLTRDCNVTCGKVGFLGLGVVRFDCIGEMLCCVVVITVVTTSLFVKSDGV